MQNQQFKIAIIGLGCISETHIAAIQNNHLGTITAICDVNPQKLKKTEVVVPYAKQYTDYTILLEETDANVIHICTPHYLHAAMTLAALAKGKDVYLEKPAAMTYQEGKIIVDAAKKANRKVCVSFQNRLTNANKAAKDIVDSGELGKIIGLKGIVTWHREGAYYTDSGWRGTWEKEGGGVLMNQSIHTLDLLHYFGGPIQRTCGSVSLRKNSGTIEVEDTAEATIWFESGATAIFYATNCHVVDSPVEVELICENGVLTIRDDILYKRMDGVLIPVTENNKLSIGKSCWGDGHRDMISNFYEAIRGNGNYYCGIEDGIEVLKIIHDIYETSKEKLGR